MCARDGESAGRPGMEWARTWRMPRPHLLPLIAGIVFASSTVAAPSTQPGAPSSDAAQPGAGKYHIYAGNTHAHTAFTWSHGEQWVNAKPKEGEEKSPLISVDKDGAQRPAKTQVLKPDWQKVQGPPAAHFARARASGYDFYITTDHSQEADFQ